MVTVIILCLFFTTIRKIFLHKINRSEHPEIKIQTTRYKIYEGRNEKIRKPGQVIQYLNNSVSKKRKQN